jgi:hypothetical protein
MALSRIDENELLVPLCQAGIDEGAWIIFLTRLRRQLQADYAGILLEGHPKDIDNTQEFYVISSNDQRMEQGIQLEFYRTAPQFHRTLRPDRVYGLEDLRRPAYHAHQRRGERVYLADGRASRNDVYRDSFRTAQRTCPSSPDLPAHRDDDPTS